MRRMLSPIIDGGIQLLGAKQNDGEQSRYAGLPRDKAASSYAKLTTRQRCGPIGLVMHA
jgi:hypothetical protein